MRILNGFLSSAKVEPSPNKGGAISPSLIVVHDTAGRLDKGSSVRWLTDPRARASAHFVVERDGTITQLVSCDIRAWHAGKSSWEERDNVNGFSIGIEFVNPGALSESGSRHAEAYFGERFPRKAYRIEERGDQFLIQVGDRMSIRSHPAALWMPYTEAQIQSGLDLCLAIRDAYGITSIAPHYEISPGRKIDTNPLFPLRWLRARVAGRDNSPRHVRVREDFPVRRWPSFYAENVVEGGAVGGHYPVIDEATYLVEGNFTDEAEIQLGSVRLAWYKLKLPDDSEAFVLKQHAEIVQ